MKKNALTKEELIEQDKWEREEDKRFEDNERFEHEEGQKCKKCGTMCYGDCEE